MRFIGIDPGLATVGYAVIDDHESSLTLVDFGVIETDATVSFAERLALISQDLQLLLTKYAPDYSAVEKLFFSKNTKTALSVSHARGVILSEFSKAQIQVYEPTPNEVKLAIAGTGSADKRQVQDMVALQFSLTEVPKPDDAADAVAIAYTAVFQYRLDKLL